MAACIDMASNYGFAVAKRFLFLGFIIVSLLGDVNSEGVDEYMETGNSLLMRGDYAKALEQYHKVIDIDSNHYMAFNRRSMVYMAMGRSNLAIKDLDSVLRLKPDHVPAIIQRGKLHLKTGNVRLAKDNFQNVLQVAPDHVEVHDLIQQADALALYSETARDHVEAEQWQEANDLLEMAIEIAPQDADLRMIRAEVFDKLGDIMQAIGELTRATKLSNDNMEGLLRLSQLHYSIGESNESLKHVRECLRLDQEHKACKEHYKVVRKLEKQLTKADEYMQSEQYNEAIERFRAVKVTDPNSNFFQRYANSKICSLYVKLKDATESLRACNAAVDQSLGGEEAAGVDAVCDLAEALIMNELYGKAVGAYQRALKMDDGNQRATEGLQRAQRLEKVSKQKNYYKILGVSRTATKKEINKAYRKLAAEHHPDNFLDKDEKEAAEVRFIDIATAKEVLTDEEKRAKFDNGEDPLDSSANRGGGNPFGHGSPFFHGGGGGGGGGQRFSFRWS